jgi:hypothetical protein
MLNKPLAATCSAALLTVGSAIFGVNDANAYLIRGAFDPNNGTYEWSGTHAFEVSDACLTQSDGWHTAGPSDPYCQIKLIGGSLTLENLDTSAGPYTLDFADFPSALNNTADVWGVYLQNGQVAGIDSYLIGGFQFTAEETNALGFVSGYDESENYVPITTFYIRWESGKAGDNVPEGLFHDYMAGPPSNDQYVPAIGDPVHSYYNDCGVPGTTAECQTTEVTPGVAAPNVTFVPEPGTLSLLLGALGLAAVARRKSRAA